MTKLEASQLIAILFGSFPSARLERTHVDAYVSGIIDLDAQTAAAAVNRLRKTSTFLPSIAEIREAATAQQFGPCARGEEAYAALLTAKRRHGYDYGRIDAWRRLKDPLFAEPHITQCLTLWGGWNAFALAADDAPARARFISMYDELTQRERRDIVSGQPLPVPSLERATNNRAALALVVPKGAAASSRESSPAPTAAAPADPPIAPPRPPRAPAREPRRWTPEELDAELTRTGGAR